MGCAFLNEKTYCTVLIWRILKILTAGLITATALSSCGGRSSPAASSGSGISSDIQAVAVDPTPAGEAIAGLVLTTLVPSLLDNANLVLPPANTFAGQSLRQMNFDPRLGFAGQGVTVAIVDSKPLQDISFLAHVDKTLVFDVQATRPADQPSSDIHGTWVAGAVFGKVDQTVYGPAHLADQEIIAIDRAGGSSLAVSIYEYARLTLSVNAEIIVQSFGRLIDHEFTDKGGNRFFIEGPDDDLTLPSIQDTTEEFYVSDDRLVILALGNDGFNKNNGVVTARYAGQNPLTVSVSDFRNRFGDSAADRFFNDIIYKVRGGVRLFPLGNPEHEPHWLTTAAIDQEFNRDTTRLQEAKLASYSNACGVTKAYCLTAPGIVHHPELDPAAGTSFAGPYVAGAAAALMSTFPNLDVSAVSTILLTTSLDLGPRDSNGERIVDDEFGWGMLDFVNAMSAQGTLSSSSGFSLAETRVSAGTALAGALTSTEATFGMFDMHQRPYLHTVTGRLQLNDGLPQASLKTRAQVVNAELEQVELALRNGDSTPSSHLISPSRFSLNLERCQDGCVSHGQTAPGGLISDVANMARGTTRLGEQIMAVAEIGSTDSGKRVYQLGALHGWYDFGDVRLGAEAGYLSEPDTFLGSSFEGALGVTGAYSRYFNTQLTAALPGALALRGSYTQGKAQAKPAKGSYVESVESTDYNALRVGLGGKLGGNETWEVFATRPLAATSGGLRIKSVGGYRNGDNEWSIAADGRRVQVIGRGDGEGVLREDVSTINFGGARRPTTLGLTWRGQMGAHVATAAQLEYMLNSPNRAFENQEARVLLQFAFDY